VEISAGVTDDGLCVDVIDRGRGIPPAEREHVFERFYRASSARGVAGTGLGLAIARGLSRSQGGDVTYHENPAGGSIFRMTLPQTDARADQ
jgi:signal transduction histidine kinase